MQALSGDRRPEVARAQLAQFRLDRWQNIAGQFGTAPSLIAITWNWADHERLLVFGVIHHLVSWLLVATFVFPLRPASTVRIPPITFVGLALPLTLVSSALWFDPVAARTLSFSLGVGIVLYAGAAGSLATLGAHPTLQRVAVTSLLLPYVIASFQFGHSAVALGTAFFYVVVVVFAVTQVGRGQTELIELRLDAAARADIAERDAQTDSLTRLVNRHGLAQMDGSTVEGTTAAFFVDLDGFKQVNDSFGHASGDIVLRAVARRLKRAVGKDTTLARLGGDEFFALATNCGEEQAHLLKNRIAQAVNDPIQVPNIGSVEISGSVGLALSDEPEVNLDGLLRASDRAMYEQKNVRTRGRHGSLHKRNRMAAAIRDGQVEVWFQPIVTLDDLQVVSAEGLARWRHPERGVLLPHQFLPDIEEMGLHDLLFQSVLAQATEFAARTDATGRPLVVAVNVIAANLRNPALPAAVLRHLEMHGLDPDRLIIELTENDLVDDSGAERAVLQELSSNGIRISMDDLGTGYSSLDRLRSLPVSSIKVDRSFVHRSADHATDRIILKAMVDLACLLGLPVVGEGIENEGQLDMLRQMGCDLGQGWLFSKAQPPDDLLQLLRADAESTSALG